MDYDGSAQRMAWRFCPATKSFRKGAQFEDMSNALLDQYLVNARIITTSECEKRGGQSMLDVRNFHQPPDRLRIIIVSEIRLYREGLARVLSELPDVEIVSTCESAPECVGLFHQVASDIVLLDMALGSASSARLFSCEFPSVRIVALAVPETEQHVLACVEAGVMGYVSREGSIDDLISAIRHAARGEALCPPSITGGLMRRVAMLAHHNSPTSRLTPRELEIAEQLALGTTNRGIATRLGIELCTVKNHVHNILDKLGVERRADVAACIRR